MTQPTPEQIQQWVNSYWSDTDGAGTIADQVAQQAFAAGAASRDAEFAPFLKDGEIPFERFTRERKDGDALLKVYGKALTEIETLRTQLAALRAQEPEVIQKVFGGIIDPTYRGVSVAPTPQEPVNQMLLDAVALAYGHLWHINNEPMAPIPLRSDGDASYAARKILRDLLTTEQRGNGINQARAAIDATIKAHGACI